MADLLITGLVLYPDSLETTTLVGTRKRVGTGDVVLPGSPAETLRAAAAAKRLRGELHAALPAEAALLTVLELPSRDPAEIASMIALRAEEITPFPAERTCSGWEILSETAGGCRVLAGLTSLGTVQVLHDALKSQHCLAHRVDIDVVAWLRLIADAEALPGEGVHLLLILHRAQTHLVLLRDGAALLFRSLGDVRAVLENELREEMSGALGSVEAEWGISEVEGLLVFHDGNEPAWARAKVAGIPCSMGKLEDLPPLSEGVARRGISGARLDLAPPQWKKEEAQRRDRRRLLRIAGSAAALWLLVVCGLVITVQLRARSVRSLREQVRQQEKPVADVVALAKRVRSLSQFTDRSHSAVEALRLMAEAIPLDAGLRVNDFQYRKDHDLLFSGEAPADATSFYTFIESLSGNGRIKVDKYDVKQQRGTSQFQVNARWHWADSDEGDGT